MKGLRPRFAWDRRDRREWFWETWLRERREARCLPHDFPEWAIMRYPTCPTWPECGNPHGIIVEAWRCCRRCEFFDIEVRG